MRKRSRDHDVFITFKKQKHMSSVHMKSQLIRIKLDILPILSPNLSREARPDLLLCNGKYSKLCLQQNYALYEKSLVTWVVLLKIKHTDTKRRRNESAYSRGARRNFSGGGGASDVSIISWIK